MSEFGDLEWHVVPINPDEFSFFEDKCVTYGHTWGECCECGKPVDLETDPPDYVVQWSNQLLPLYGWIETPEADFGHRECLLKRRKPRPLMEMPDLFCCVCNTKLTDTRISVNSDTFCSLKCFDNADAPR